MFLDALNFPIPKFKDFFKAFIRNSSTFQGFLETKDISGLHVIQCRNKSDSHNFGITHVEWWPGTWSLWVQILTRLTTVVCGKLNSGEINVASLVFSLSHFYKTLLVLWACWEEPKEQACFIAHPEECAEDIMS